MNICRVISWVRLVRHMWQRCTQASPLICCSVVAAPNIYIYEFPSLNIYRVLRDGTEAGYADLDFNTSGTKMASVGGKPDFMLTVWNWETEGIMLRSKVKSNIDVRVQAG